MDTGKAKSLVLIGVGASTLTAAMADLSEARLPKATIIVGGFAAAMMLSALAEFAPDLAASFAVMLAVGAFLGAGDAAANQFTQSLTPPDTPSPRPDSRNTRIF